MLYRRKIGNEIVKINALPPAFAEPLFDKWLRHVVDNEGGIAGLDVETTALDDVLGPFEPGAELRTVQLGSRRYAWVLDPSDPFWRGRIVDVLWNSGLRFVTHTNYDVLWCHREFEAPIDERWIDTLVMAALLYPGHDRRDLKNLATRHVDNGLVEAELELHARFSELAPRLPIANGQLRKPTGKTLLNWGFSNVPLDDAAYNVYGGLDAIYVRRVLDVLAEMVRRTRASKTPLAPLSRREQRIARITTAMRVRGMRVDGQWARELLDDVEREYGVADERLRELFGFSPRSPKVGDWLEERGATFTEHTPTGRPKLTMPSASSDGTLPQLAELHEADDVLGPVFADLLTLGSHKNMLTNLRIIVAAAANDPENCVHPQINTQQAHTGRMSFTKPAVQTYKKRDPRLRGCYIARDGYVLVGADYDSQEVRIGAAYSRDEVLLAVVREGANQHLVTAKALFGVEDKTTVMNALTGKTFYDAAKTLDFGQQYGLGPAKLGDQLGYPSKLITTEDGDTRRRAHPKAYKMWRGWRHTYAGLVAWSEKLAEKNMIVNPWGRRIPADRFRPYANANYAIQSTGRDVLGDAIVRLEDAGWAHRIWALLHDEIILEVPEDEADAAAAILEQCMPHRIRDIELPVTAKVIGYRWGADND